MTSPTGIVTGNSILPGSIHHGQQNGWVSLGRSLTPLHLFMYLHIYYISILCVYIYILCIDCIKNQFIPFIKAYSEEWGQGMQPCAGHSLDYSKPSNLTHQKPCTALFLQGYKNRPSQYKLWHLRVILHHLTSSLNSVLLVPSGKRLHNYAKSPCYENL